MTKFLAALMIFAALPVYAGTAVVDTSVAYDSEMAAATAGEKLAETASRSVEYAGVIVQTGGKYYISQPVTSGQEGHFALSIKLTASQKLVALYHSHPSKDGLDGVKSQQFSADDVTVAKSLKVHSYIGVQYDHTLRVFVPGQTHVSLCVSDGETLGSF